MAKKDSEDKKNVEQHELQELRSEWKWFFALGLGMILLGIMAVGSSYVVGQLTVALFGVLILIGGVAQVLSSFWAGKWSGFLLHLLVGILYIVVGVIMIDDRENAVMVISALLAGFFIVSGIFRIVAAMSMQFSNWGWVLLNGVVTLMLGLFVYKNWPEAGVIFIGLYIGIEMILNGWYWVMLGAGLKKLAEE